MSDFTITRDELVEVIARAAEGITASTRAKLLKVAETTDAVAVGWWHCDGVSCPMRQASRRNQAFMTAYDKAMAERFGRTISGMGLGAFVVRVAPAETQVSESGAES